MAQVTIHVDQLAQNGVLPRFCRVNSSVSLATTIASGFLNPYLSAENVQFLITDFVFVSATDGNQIYQPTISPTGVVALVALG